MSPTTPMPDSHSIEPALPACPITGSTRSEALCSETFIDGSVWDWIRFPESGFVRLAQMPTMDEVVGLQDKVGEGYVGLHEAKWASKRRRSRNRARYLKWKMRGSGRVLDVGSNVGLFCAAAKDIGLEPTGLEISDGLIAYSRKRFPELEFHSTPLERFEADGMFDAVYCSEVIEHSTDPVGFGRKLFDLLRPGGMLYLTTPDLKQYLDSKGRPKCYLGAPDHKLYFTRTNIVDFLKQIGFSNVGRKFTFKAGIQIIAYK